MSYDRDSGTPAYGNANTNVAVDFVFGNFPIQPNEDRGGEGAYYLNAGDSHAIALTEWNGYPALSTPAGGSRNYMITAFEFLGDVLYECTSQNNLKAGEVVVISNIGWYEGPVTRTVTYADATRFQFLDEAGYPPKLTALNGRVDVIGEPTGRTFEEGCYWPAVGLCNTWGIEENRLETVKKELLACGVPASWLTDAQWTGGDHSYDDETGTYDTNSGRIFYWYLDPTSNMGTDAQGVPVYGSAFDGTVIYGSGMPDSALEFGIKDAFNLVVFQTHTPGLETADWL